MEIIYEQVESPEYISLCEAKNWGYCTGVTTDGLWVQQKVWCSDDINNKEFRTFNVRVMPDFGGKAPEPYRITHANGTYVDPITARNNWLNKNSFIAMPAGTLKNTDDLPKFNVKYNSDEDGKL